MSVADQTPPIIQRRTVPSEFAGTMPGGLHPVLQRVYASRHVSPADLDVSLSSMLPVSSLEHVEDAAKRIATYRNADRPVLVLGDFDADGATATALMMTCLRLFGYANAGYLVPDRFRLGYGLTPEIAELAAHRNPALIVTVDNGITSREGIARAHELGIDVIVTDHHLPGDELPAAEVIVNPNLPDSDFPSKSLCGVGVAFYVMAALGQLLARQGTISERDARKACADCLDLVALGTVADLVRLDRNNRVLVAEGLRRMRAGRARPGISALFDVAGKDIRDATTADLAFGVAPRLNAAGRLTDMSLGIDCLLSADRSHATQLANRLDALNAERRRLQHQMQAQAEGHLDRVEELTAGLRPGGYCLFDDDWHQGIVGLVATRIRERVRGPAVAFARGDDGLLKGSARSVAGINVRDVIAAVAAREPGLVEKFGGHAMAAGITLLPEHLDRFRGIFEDEVSGFSEQLGQTEVLWTDGALEPNDFGLQLAEVLRTAGPWGQGFPEPMFDNKFEMLDQRIVGEHHLKLRLRPEGSDASVDAIAFNQREIPPQAVAESTFVFRLDINTFRNSRSHQLVVQKIQYD